MDELKPDMGNPYHFRAKRAEIQQELQTIKTFIWAGNWTAAHQELETSLEKHWSILRKAVQIKKTLTSIYRQQVGQVENKLRAQGLKGLSLDYQIQMKMAEMTALTETDDHLMYFLSPFAATLRKLDEQIAKQLGQKPLLDKQGEFHRRAFNTQKPVLEQPALYRLVLSSIGPCHWEVRGYSEPSSSNDTDDGSPHYLLDRLASNFAGEQVTLEQGKLGEQIAWPIWHRLFLVNAFIELKFYDLNRFVIILIVYSEDVLEPLLGRIMTVITECKQTKIIASGTGIKSSSDLLLF